jgi:ribose/xylose/arabinose/galactoside ABC-type transport system permease subunit
MSASSAPASVYSAAAGVSPTPLKLSLSTMASMVAFAILAVTALLTPGFTSVPSLIALTGAISLIGCIAVGMTFITLSGNIMSFSLGATCAATAMVVSALSAHGLVPAVTAGMAFAMVLATAQGLLIGLVRANPLIISIAFLSLMLGVAQLLVGGQSIYADAQNMAPLNRRIWQVPVAALVFVGAVVAGELILRSTRFGHNVILVGSNLQAATVAGLRTWRTVAGCYLAAGFFSGLSGVLIAARFGSGSMEFGVGYDYSAISAVLVGGTAIAGGQGSVLRTMAGVVMIAVLQSLLLLHGFESHHQHLLTGLIVLGVILLQAKGRRA